MGLQDGKKNVESIQAFNAKSREIFGTASPLEMVARTIQKNLLGEKHFDQIEALINSMRDAAKIKAFDDFIYNKKAPLKNRKLEHLMCYMVTYKGGEGNLKADNFCPTFANTILTRDSLSYSQRPLPMILSSDHVETKHIEHTSKTLDYNGDDFHCALSCSLPFAIAHTRIMAENNAEYMPTVIPTKDGFYSGHAFMCHDQDFYPLQSIASLHKAPNGKPALHGQDAKAPIKPRWSPQSYSYIQTLVSRNDFYPRQEELFEILHEKTTKNPVFKEVMINFISDYTNNMPKRISAKDEKVMMDLADTLCAVMRTKLWKSAVLDKTTPAMRREFGISSP